MLYILIHPEIMLYFLLCLSNHQVGTLDQLVGLSDDLSRLDTFVEGVMRKMAHYFGEVRALISL